MLCFFFFSFAPTAVGIMAVLLLLAPQLPLEVKGANCAQGLERCTPHCLCLEAEKGLWLSIGCGPQSLLPGVPATFNQPRSLLFPPPVLQS